MRAPLKVVPAPGSAGNRLATFRELNARAPGARGATFNGALPIRLILASASPRRRALMAAAGYRFQVREAAVEEHAPAHLTVGEITLFNAKAKALAVAKLEPDAVVIGADTLVALEGEIFGKPRTLEEAGRMLQRLSGRAHEVCTGVWVAWGNGARGGVTRSRVWIRSLNEAERVRYLARIGPLDKAGAYAAQDESAESVVEAIEGSRSNVIGLPMEALAQLLQQLQQLRAPL